MKKYLRFTASVLCIAMLAGCGKGNDMPPADQEETITSVEVQNPIIETIKDEYKYSGTIQAAETVDVSAKVSGTVKKTNFKVGDKVKKGDVLYTIDDTDYQVNLKSAQSSLASAKSGVTTAQLGVESAKNSVKSAQTSVDTANGATMKSQLESAQNSITNAQTNLETAKKSVNDCEVAVTNAQTNYDKAKNDYDMNSQLFEVGGISADSLNNYKIALEQAENALTTAKNSQTKAELNVKSAQDALSQAQTNYNILSKETTAENTRKANDGLASAKTGVKTAQQSVTTAQNSVKSAEVAVENAKLQIQYCTVTAPCDGTVLTKNAIEGAMIQGVGYQIVDLTSVDVEVKASEQIATSVKVGDAVTINIPSLDNKKTTGSITQIPPSANTDGTYTIKINIPNPDGTLKGGIFAEVYFAKSTSNNAVIIPRDAVMNDDDGNTYVYLENGDTAKKVTVETGIDTGDTIEVTSGLSLNDKVVVKGQTYLADGDKINVVSDNGEEITTESTTAAPADDSKKDEKAKGKEDK